MWNEHANGEKKCGGIRLLLKKVAPLFCHHLPSSSFRRHFAIQRIRQDVCVVPRVSRTFISQI